MTRVVIDNGGTNWLTPLVTLLAVVVGRLVNWAAQGKLADKREERERQVAEEQAEADAAVQARIDDAEMRTAARLIQADLSVVAGHLNTIVRTGEWAEYLRLDLPNWGAEQRTIAKRLDRDDWQAVSLAALELPGLDAGWRLVSEPAAPGERVRRVPIDPAGKPGLEQMWDHATAAWNALAPFAGEKTVTGRLHAGEARPTTDRHPGGRISIRGVGWVDVARLGTRASPVPVDASNGRNLRPLSSPRRVSESRTTAGFRPPDRRLPHSSYASGRTFETRGSGRARYWSSKRRLSERRLLASSDARVRSMAATSCELGAAATLAIAKPSACT
jgi:hypothetical protein